MTGLVVAAAVAVVAAFHALCTLRPYRHEDPK
jgi:hypothetical protein